MLGMVWGPLPLLRLRHPLLPCPRPTSSWVSTAVTGVTPRPGSRPLLRTDREARSALMSDSSDQHQGKKIKIRQTATKTNDLSFFGESNHSYLSVVIKITTIKIKKFRNF